VFIIEFRAIFSNLQLKISIGINLQDTVGDFCNKVLHFHPLYISQICL
jgi:hypothetical protein